MTTDPKQYCTGCSVRDEHVDAITEQLAEKDSRIAELEEAIETGHAIIDVMRQSVSIMPEHRKQLALVLGLPETATVPEMIVRGGRLADAERRTAAMIKAIADTHNEMQRVSADVENMLGDRMQSVIMQLRSALKASPRPAGSVDVIGRPLPVAPEAVTKSTAKRLAVQRDEPDPILRHCIPLQPARADRERLKTAQDLPTPPEITDEVRAQILAEAKEWRASVRAPHPPDPPESERAEPIARQSGALDAFSIVSQDRDTWKQRAQAAESEAARQKADREEFERQARIRAEREAKERAERERIGTEERRVAELERKAAEERRIEAIRPDVEKVHGVAAAIRNLAWPEVKSDEARAILTEVFSALNVMTTRLEGFAAEPQAAE
jgi:hypothetical protein